MIQLNLTLTPDQLVAVGIALGASATITQRLHNGTLDHIETIAHTTVFDKIETTNRDGDVETSTAAAVFDLPTITLDADGIPWDARIHASTRATNADGRWKRRRGVDDVEVTRVEMEIGPRGQTPVPPPAAANTVAPPVPPPAAATNRSTVTDFVGLMGAVTAKGIDMATLQAEVVAHGLNTIAELPARPDLVNSIATAIGV